MFFFKQLTRTVSLHPSFFGKGFQATLERKLKSDLEGVWTESYGYIMLVAEVSDFGKGKVQEETGHALFSLKFQALCYKPFRGEVLDAAVTQCNAHGFFAAVGPVRVFVPEDHLPADFHFDVNAQAWQSADEAVAIKEDSSVRLRVLQVKALDGFCLGSIKDDFLGVQ